MDLLDHQLLHMLESPIPYQHLQQNRRFHI